MQLCPLYSASQQEKMNSILAPLIHQPHRHQKGKKARVNQRGQSMRSILPLQFLGPYLSYTTHFIDAKEDSAPRWRCQQCLGDGTVTERLYLGWIRVFVCLFFLQIEQVYATNRKSRTLWMLLWKGLRKSRYILGQWLLIFFFFKQLRLL